MYVYLDTSKYKGEKAERGYWHFQSGGIENFGVTGKAFNEEVTCE